MSVAENHVLPFQIEGANVRGRLVRLGSAYREILSPHNYPAPVASMLGEMFALTAALATSLKFDGIFIMQTQADGPIGMMVADVASNGGMRGYARYSDDAFADDADIEPSVPHLLGNGNLAFTVDQGRDTDRYQGITALEGATLAECAQAYFRQSEQLETAILLAADPVSARAGALMIQRMAGGERDDDLEDDAWRTAVILMSSMTTDELLDPAISDQDLLLRLYHDSGVRVFDKIELRYHCRCSGDKVAETLAAFSAEELQDMKEDDGRIVATCEFCRTEYAFDDKALEKVRTS